MKTYYLEEINSTNSYCKENIETYSDKTIIYTFHQTNGRGRFNRTWTEIGKDNLYMSIILKPSDKYKQVYANITQYTCLKLAEIIKTYTTNVEIKWPNDILVNKKKISGILAEAVYKNEKLKGLVIGVGINLNSEKSTLEKINQPATSLNLETGKFVDKQNFLSEFGKQYFNTYDKFIENGFISIKDDYLKYCKFLNTTVKIQENNGEKTVGKAKEVTDDGAIIINGKKYYSGDILISN